jgi:hypothetical protein
MSSEEEKRASAERKTTYAQKIKEIMDAQENNTGRLTLTHEINYPINGPLRIFTVFDIPLKYLAFNKNNGRIASVVQTLEARGLTIDPYTDKGEEILDKLLYASKKERNDQTQRSLLSGQTDVGIITRDGLVIDGNRRSMLLKRNFKESSGIEIFKAVVFKDITSDDIDDIENYETQYQLGSESKVDYDPIDIYIKIQKMYDTYKSSQDNFESSILASELGLGAPASSKKFDSDEVDINAVKRIFKKYQGYKTIKTEKDVIFFLEVMSTMEQYLDDIGHSKNYIFLNGREEQFRGLTRWLKQYKDCESKKLFDTCTKLDIEQLRLACYDYIRIKTTNDDFRKIGGAKDASGHVIGVKNAWTYFRGGWKTIKNANRVDTQLNIDTDDFDELIKNINNSEKEFNANLKELLIENLEDAFELVRDVMRSNKPTKLIEQAEQKIESININTEDFKGPEVQKNLLNLVSNIEDKIIKRSTVGALKSIETKIGLIKKDIKNGNHSDSEIEEFSELAKSISSIAYKIQKLN